MKVGVIIAAAGAGRRLKSERPKQFLSIEGRPILAHTLSKFDRCELVDYIIVAAPKDALDETQSIVDSGGFSKPIRVVEGGQRRQDSSAMALNHIEPDTDVVAIHDAVRPLVQVEDIEAVIREAYESGAAILAVPVVDTVKQVGRDVIESTVAREHLVLAQTPQAFRSDILREAFRAAAADGYYGTDESSLVERIGKPVRVVRGHENNIKITRPSDLKVAQFLLREEP